jgi:hypothetical protein
MRDFALLVGNGINAPSNGPGWKDLLDKLVTFCQCPELQTDEKHTYRVYIRQNNYNLK